MRIAILGTRGIPSGYSGPEALVEEVGARLAERGHSVTVYAHANMFDKKQPNYRGVKIVYLPSLKGKNTSQFSHSLLATSHVVFTKVEVVLFITVANGPFGLILKLLRKRSAINVDGMEWLRPKWGNIAKKYFRFGARCAVLFFDKVVTDASAMADVYRNEFDCDSVCITYGAEWGYSENPELIEQYGLEPSAYYLIASRLIPDNNADLIVKAFVASNSKRKLAVAGGAPYSNPFGDKLRETKDDRIIFLGHINDSNVIKELHCNTYAYIHGHEFGGTNPALLKALAYGNCILALDTVFNREVLKDGEYGLFFKKDPQDLIRLLNEIDQDTELVDDFRAKSRDRIKEAYTWDKITDQYEELFESLSKKGK